VVRLRRSPVLAGIEPRQRDAAAAILASGPLRRWAAGASGGLAAGSTGLVCVVAGRVELRGAVGRGRQVTLARAGTGDVLASLPGDLVPEARAVVDALEESWLCPLDAAHLDALAAHPQVIARLTLRLVGRLEEAQAAIMRVAQPRVEDRVLLALRALAAREGRVTTAGLHLARVRHRDLALVAHVTRPRVTQALAALQRQGRLVRTGEGVLLPLGVLPGARRRRLQPLPGVGRAA
jgi:CRP-like cAMP-binding protein